MMYSTRHLENYHISKAVVDGVNLPSPSHVMGYTSASGLYMYISMPAYESDRVVAVSLGLFMPKNAGESLHVLFIEYSVAFNAMSI